MERLTQKRSRQRKRPLSLHHSNDDLVVTAEVVPLVLPGSQDGEDAGDSSSNSRGWIRIIQPYPWAFVTHAKQRWIGRTLKDVYATDFGAYPASYYDTAIQQGRILVNDMVVKTNYLVKDKDVLSHCVHRHEPAVAVAGPKAAVQIVAETDDLLVVNKPPTMPIHPCGGYHKNTLIDILDTERNVKHYTIHRLDRLTSGLVLVAKSSAAARTYITVMQQQRDSCQKLYLAKVTGQFAACVPTVLPRIEAGQTPVHGEWPDKQGRAKNAHCYWLSSFERESYHEGTLQDFSRHECSLDDWLSALGRSFSKESDASGEQSDLHWLHLASPTRVEQHKNGLCSCGTFRDLSDDVYARTVKPAETSFALIHYDKTTDSSLVLCRPRTGRCHQIRLHLQLLGNPIANDPNYGGYLWWTDLRGENDCRRAKEQLESLSSDAQETPSNAGQLQPATQQEVHVLHEQTQNLDEPLEFFIRRTCVWCKRSGACTVDRSILEFLSRSPSIFLHAIQYSLRLSAEDSVSFSTDLPDWAN